MNVTDVQGSTPTSDPTGSKYFNHYAMDKNYFKSVLFIYKNFTICIIVQRSEYFIYLEYKIAYLENIFLYRPDVHKLNKI